MHLWLLVVAIGAYHGLNPGMGWPLAVSNGLFRRSQSAVVAAMAPLALGHFLAMAAVLLPFSLLAAYLDWARPIRIGAAALVVAFGLWRLVDARHPRLLARIRPNRLALWSFLMATAHGAGLMLIPITLGLCATPAHAGAVEALMRSSIVAATVVALVHTIAMLTAGGALALAVYRWLGPRAIGAAWFNLDRIWAASLILAGAAGGVAALGT